MRQPNGFGVVKNDSYEDVPLEVPVGREIGSRGRGGSRTGRRSVEQTIHHCNRVYLKPFLKQWAFQGHVTSSKTYHSIHHRPLPISG